MFCCTAPLHSGDEYSAKFLIENKANVNAATLDEKETPLHLVASFNAEFTSTEVINGMACCAQILLSHGANPNAQDSLKRLVYISTTVMAIVNSVYILFKVGDSVLVHR